MKVRMNHAGIMVTIKEDNYKRVDADYGSYTYPKLLENRLRKRVTSTLKTCK